MANIANRQISAFMQMWFTPITPPAGAYRGYGVPQGYWPVDRHMEKIARALGLRSDRVPPEECHPRRARYIRSALPGTKVANRARRSSTRSVWKQCVRQGKAAIGWDEKYGNADLARLVAGTDRTRRQGIGVAMVMQGTAIPYLDMGGASIKMNDDGSFNLLVGATDLGTGSDTVLAQMAAEVLGVPWMILSPTHRTRISRLSIKARMPLQTTYISGTAVVKAAEMVAERIKTTRCTHAAGTLESTAEPEDIRLADRKAIAPDGRIVTAGRDRTRFAPPRRPGTDHGGCIVCFASVTASVCCAVCRGDGGY